jgi:hypothetical protein
VTGGLIVFLCALSLFLVPLPIYLLATTPKPPKTVIAASLVVAIFVPSLCGFAHAPPNRAPARLVSPALSEVSQLLSVMKGKAPKKRSGGKLAHTRVLSCKSEPVAGDFAVTYRKGRKPTAVCLQGDMKDRLAAFEKLLKKN